ncbi:hypothetical protein DFH09DRAFT_1323115 [Mycena vulgaris]|nr:hypothetical protein DFH09DRAFT_1323115 [Mycena vulgaris]
MTASASAPADPTGILGPLACPVSSQSSSQFSASSTLTADPCGSTLIHPRDFALSVRKVTNSAEARIKGQGIWAKISVVTADESPVLTTDKFIASYRAIFPNGEAIPTNVVGQNGNDILSLFNKETANGVDLTPRLFPGLPDTLHRFKNTGTEAYTFVFSPGVIVAVASFHKFDPVRPVSAQVHWNVIAMELYKSFRGTDGPTDLKFVMRFQISNPLTVAVLQELYANSGMSAEAKASDTVWRIWNPNDGACGTNAVLTLLGTDNGSGAGYILADYQTTLGGKKIVNVYTRRQSRWWSIVTEYAPL